MNISSKRSILEAPLETRSRRRHRWLVPILFTALVGVSATLARPGTAEARPTSVGFYTEGGLGATGFLGAGQDYSKIGPNLELRMGYDLFKWLSVGGLFGLSTHEATVPPPPVGEYFQMYTALAEARIGVSVGPVNLFVDGGFGFAAMSSNVLSQVAILDPGESFSVALRAGGGLEYQLQNRHYAIGLAGQWMNMPGFASLTGVSTRLYLRYTY